MTQRQATNVLRVGYFIIFTNALEDRSHLYLFNLPEKSLRSVPSCSTWLGRKPNERGEEHARNILTFLYHVGTY